MTGYYILPVIHFIIIVEIVCDLRLTRVSVAENRNYFEIVRLARDNFVIPYPVAVDSHA